MRIELEHKQGAHCESGTTANLLRFHGISLSEPMVFGIGSGLFFTYLPFIKVNGAPLFSFRIFPGGIVKRLTRALGIKLKFKTYRNTGKGMDALDQELENGHPAGMVTGVFHIPYFPPEYRFHFNAHHILAVGKEGEDYLISDPVMGQIEKMSALDLQKARFSKGELAPKGKMYTMTHVPASFDLKKAIRKGIRRTCRDMLSAPIPFVGIKGIRLLSKQLRQWPEKLGSKRSRLYLGQIIRMSEEIGTGGAGFRFIYGAFLQEAAEVLKQEWLEDASKEMTRIGDKWREFAYLSAKNFKKNKRIKAGDFDILADKLLEIASQEELIYQKLKKIK